jgi:glycogen debranching enzyme
VPVGWTFVGEPSTFESSEGVVTLVEGATFCISGRAGDITPGLPHGLFVRDTRLLSGWRLLLDGVPPDVLTTMPAEPFATTFVGRDRPRQGRADSTLLLLRHRYVGQGMREDLVLRNVGASEVDCRLRLEVAADFADLFEVKEQRVRPRGAHQVFTLPGQIAFERRLDGDHRGVRVEAPGWTADAEGALTIAVTVPARGEWVGTVQVHPSYDGVEGLAPYPTGQPVDRAEPARRLRDWRHSTSVVDTQDEGFTDLVARSAQDLGALRIVDPHDASQVAVAAGAPWFMTIFGRDSLLTSWMALPLDPSLAVGTLRTLARYQGTVVDPRRDEEPGRILHEIRHGMDSVSALGGGSVYYGSADASPLFVMLLGELHRWGLAGADVDELLPTADRALGWVEGYGDRDGDGYVEYQRAADTGLVNQGWKDSFDGITFADGRIAEPPIALAEVQGYVYAAYVARAEIARSRGDEATADRYAARACELKVAFNRDFWLPDRGYFALALDADKRPVDSLASNLGHCLWTGIVDQARASSVAAALTGPEMFSGWGLRTLASTMAAYNPMSYHNGSVWPHDNAIAVAGLMRYGFVTEAQRVARAVMDAGEVFAGRLPELFCGFDRAEFEQPVPYPTSCSPQAWAAASPLLLLRSLLRLDPDVPKGCLGLAPRLLPELGRVQLENVRLAGASVSLSVDGNLVEVRGLPEGIVVIGSTPRRDAAPPAEGG